jgi:hypothetical protein
MIATQPRVNPDRLSLRFNLREGAAKMPCQRGFGSLSPGRLRESLGGNRREVISDGIHTQSRIGCDSTVSILV